MTALLRLLTWTLALGLVALPVVAVLNGWIGAERWPLRTLRVGGELQRVDAQTVREAVLPHARAGFFAMRLDDAQRAVAQLPWVSQAEVRKRWPDMVEVRVIEHRPFARWGDARVLSQDGAVFPVAAAELPAGLPHFDIKASGTDIAEVVAFYNQARELFAVDGRTVRTLSQDRRGSWSLTLSGGTEVMIGGQETRLRLRRFARLLPQLLARNPQPLARADLRYTNGFALTWAEEQGPGTGDRGPESVQQSANPTGLARAFMQRAHDDSSWSKHAFFPVPGPRSLVPALSPQALPT